MAVRQLPAVCPSCQHTLKVGRLYCQECGAAVEGDFSLPILARLEGEDQRFVVNFLKSNGSLKEVARVYGVSYPTVRNRLDALIEKVKALEAEVTEHKEI